MIHGSHASIRIYYAKFPNEYLSEIAKHGAHYRKRSPLDLGVTLHRTKKFHMRDATERVELFKLTAKLLNYLISGHSHVGYLFNYATNPIHYIPNVVHDAITVELPPAGEDDVEEDDVEYEGHGSPVSEATELEEENAMMID